jgi:hypothetical protein
MNPAFLQLQSVLRDRFPAATAPFSPPSPPAAASANEVCLLPGKVIEIVASGPHSAAGMILMRLLEQLDHSCALVDGADAFDWDCIDAETRQRLLWVRCHRATEAVRAADLLLRDGNLRTLFLDLRLLPTKSLLGLPTSVWHRLRMLAERSNAALAVFSPHKVVSCVARRWTMHSAFDLTALEQPRAVLWGDLAPQLQNGIRLVA